MIRIVKDWVRNENVRPDCSDAEAQRASISGQIWQVLRINKAITILEIQAMCGGKITEKSVRKYVSLLKTNGYVSGTTKNASGRTLYRLQKNTGPRHPLQRVHPRLGKVYLYDQNLNQFLLDTGAK